MRAFIFIFYIEFEKYYLFLKLSISIWNEHIDPLPTKILYDPSMILEILIVKIIFMPVYKLCCKNILKIWYFICILIINKYVNSIKCMEMHGMHFTQLFVFCFIRK